MRAILLASATATTLNGRRARSCVSQGYFPGFSWARRNTAIARVKKYQSAYRRGSFTFCNNFVVCSFSKDLKTLTISTPSLRLDGKASGQTLTEIGRI